MYAYEQYDDDQHHFHAPVPAVVQGGRAACIGRARPVTRAFTARLTPASDPDRTDPLHSCSMLKVPPGPARRSGEEQDVRSLVRSASGVGWGGFFGRGTAGRVGGQKPS